MKEAKTPIAEASFFDREALRVEEQADEAAETGPGVPEQEEPDDQAETVGRTPRLDHWFVVAAGTILEGPDYSPAREISVIDPNASVMTSFRETEKIARASLAISRMEPATKQLPLPEIVALLGGSVSDEFVTVARELSALRNSVTHGADDVTAAGARSFIGACERLGNALVWSARSKLRHPSRSQAVRDLLDEAGYSSED